MKLDIHIAESSEFIEKKFTITNLLVQNYEVCL